MINRIISTQLSKTKKSVLLLGPRQVGKSTLMNTLKPQLKVNLAREEDFLLHSSQPGELQKQIEVSRAQTILVDEVQRIPSILNTIQSLLDENKQLKFFLTRSSARKLKRGGANLLPGRVLNYRLGPLVAAELGTKIDTQKILSLGSLPEIYLSSDAHEGRKIIKSYVANYLKEEIKAEALTQNLEAFSRFLHSAILSCSQFVDYTKLAKASKISRHSIPRYFEILEDTLLGYLIRPFEPLQKEADLIKHPKFFLFDTGVYNSILNNFEPSLDRIGVLSENLVFSQMLHSAWAFDKEIQISTFRTRKDIEVDFIVKVEQSCFGVEVKNSAGATSEDCEGLSYFSKLYPQNKGLFIFHMEKSEKKLGKIWSLPWYKGLSELGLNH